jgi:SNF2 family DNA or RNA helicase
MPKLMGASLDKLVKAGLFENPEAYKEALSKSSKLDFVVSSILERKDNGCGKLVFCNYRQEIDDIATRLRSGGMRVAIFDGRTTQSMRHDILSQKNDALILQIQTGCEGLNLQENYSEIYFVSPHWNPSVEDQAIARCHRIGQTKPVYVRRFEMAKFDKDEEQTMDTVTIDSYVSSVQDKKRIITAECINVE